MIIIVNWILIKKMEILRNIIKDSNISEKNLDNNIINSNIHDNKIINKSKIFSLKKNLMY
jgi:hypothetical protein